MKPVNEDSACTIRARFYDSTGSEFTPSTAQWRLRDFTNSRVLQDWTSLVVAGSSIDIAIAASFNEIYDDRKAYQDHALSVQADTGLSSQFTEEITYKVKNLKAVRR